MFHPGKLIYGSKIIILLTIILVVSASFSQRESKKAQNTISRFLRSKTGTSWLAKLAQMKSGPLTTRELMDQLIKATKPDEKVSKSAKILRKALETQKLNKESSDDGPDAWDDLVKDLGNQDDIICLYRKNSNSSMRKADDWKKFLKSVSIGYTLHLALDKGKKYVICLKKIDVPEIEDTPGSETTTQEVPWEMASQQPDLKETTKEPDGEDDSKEITKDVETTDMNQVSEIEEISEPKLKLPETRKSRFGPSIDDIKEAESEEDSEVESEECSEEDSEEDDGEDNEDQKIEKAVEDDTNLKLEHPQCNRPIILVMQNPYGLPGSPNFSQFYFPQVPKNPLQPVTNRPRNFVYPTTSTLNPKNRWPFRYPFSNILNKYSKSNPKSLHHPKHFRTFLPKTEASDHKTILGLSSPKSGTEVQKPFGKYKPVYSLKTTGHNLRPSDQKRSRKSSEKELKEPAQNWYLENPKLPLETNNAQMPISDLPNSRPRIGPNLFASSAPIRNIFPNNWNRYNPLLLNRSPYSIGSNKNMFLIPQIQRCLPNFPGKFEKNQWNLNPYRNLQLNPNSYWMNQPNNQQIFPNQLVVPNNKQIFSINQERLPINQPTFSNSGPSLDKPNDNSEPNPNSGKCPSLCDKPIELRITVEGNVDKPVKIGLSSQPGTWVNIVNNNSERNSRRMLGKKENIVEDENEENEKDDESEETEEVTENFNDELIENSDKDLEKNETSNNHKKNLDQEEDSGNGKTEKNKTETEAEARILPEITTLPATKPADTTEITVPPV